MKYISVCSGIEAATCAWHPLGWEPFAFSEIEAFPSAVLAHHYPAVPNLGDMTKFKEWPDATIDLLVGGTPCQSFSVAGLRKGLADPRGNLMLTYLAIADRYRPAWLVWENVPGVLSSNEGRDFGALLGGLAKLGYGFAYRVLDAQYFGVPQRRRRVFVVGCLGDWRRAAAVLFERQSLSGNPPPSREAWKGIASPIAAGSTRGSGYRNDADTADNLIPSTCPTLRAGGNRTGGDRPPGTDVDTCDSLIPIAFDTTQITSPANRSNPQAGDPCHPLAAGMHPPAIAFDCKSSGQNGFGVGEIASTLRSMSHPSSHQNGGGHQAVAYGLSPDTFDRDGEAASGTAADRSGLGVDAELAYALRAKRAGGVVQGMAVRRLTPMECERLQGFPDDYTLIPWGREVKEPMKGCVAVEDDNGVWHHFKPTPDGPRYKALGNSMAVPVMAWIGRRIAEVDAIAGAERMTA